MSDQSHDKSEPVVVLDYTIDEAREWRDAHEGYRASPFFDLDGQLREGFVTELDHRDKDFRGMRLETYVDYLTTQLDYVQEDRGLTAWRASELEELATDVFNTVGRGRIFKIRKELLQDLTASETWGLQRYEQLREQLAVRVTESVGADTIAEILDVRPEYQFERFAEEDPFSQPKLIDVPSVPNTSVAALCRFFRTDQRSLAKTALPFIDEIHPTALVEWYLENSELYPLETMAKNRWQDITYSSFELDVVEFVSALILTVDPADRSSHQVEQFERKLRQRIERVEKSPRAVTKALAEFSRIEQKKLGPLERILESSAKTSESPLHSFPERMSADRGAKTGGKSESKPTAPDRDDVPAQVPIRANRDEGETYLFIISRRGKPKEITPKGVDPTEFGIDEVLSEATLRKESLVAYPAPDTQRPAIEQMAKDDIILIFDGKDTYDTEYRVMEVVEAPDTIASIWPESRDESTGTSKYPYLILMESHSLRSIPQPALNSLLGYNLSAVPTRWKVAEERLRTLTDAGQSIEAVLDSLDQS